MLMRKMIIGMILAVLVSMSTTAWGIHYYVDRKGDDSNGLSWASAFNTIQQGIEAKDATIVEVNEDMYPKNIDFNGISCTVKSTDRDDDDVASSTDMTAMGRVDVDSVSNTGKGGPDSGYESLESATILYVDEDATGNDDGTSWTDAFNYLQDALDDVSSGDEIWVAEGTYYPDDGDTPTNDDRTEKFQLVNNVGVYGGFDATETARSQRDWVNHVTILSGDIGTEGVDTDNSYHVVKGAPLSVLDGFTITKGYADGTSSNGRGGGMYNSGSYSILTVRNCVFCDNFANFEGGGLNNEHYTAVVTNCVFSQNTCDTYGGGFSTWYASPTITNCLFICNTAWLGGGAEISEASATFTNNTFTGNLAFGASSHGGGMVNTFYSTTTLTNCIFWDNDNEAASSGNEIYNANFSDLTIGYCDIEGGWNGSGVYTSSSSTTTSSGGNINTDPEFINIFDFTDGTVAAGSTDYIKVEDADLYTVGDEIEYDNDGTLREVTAINTGNDRVTFEDDPLSSNSAADKVIYNWGNGATDADEDLHLDLDSPCINVGDSSGDYDGQKDMDGRWQ
jgi:hypothetical protein